MTVLTVSETALLRSRPQNTKLYLSIFQPREVFSAQITGSVAKGDQTFSLYNGSGTAIGFRENQTVLVGTTSGGDDKGRIRVRSFTTGTITVAENSHINWQVGDWITIVNFYEVWPIYPRIIQDPGDPTKTLWYKDYDVPYTNQNSALGHFICMGSHYAGFLENGQHQVYYTADGTEHVRSDETGTSYHWVFGGGNPSSYTGKTPGWITYTTPGYYTTRLSVSGSVTQGANFSSRHIAIYDKLETGTTHPISQWELLDLSGSRDQGGYTASIRIFEDVSNIKIRDGSLIVVFADDRYGTTDQSIGGNSTNRSNIFFVGYIIDGTIKYNYRYSYVDFDVQSVTEMMKMAEGFSVSVQDSDDPAGDAASNPDIPSGWVALLDMDIKKALFHYLRWHSTVLNVSDFQYVGTNQRIQYFDADRTSIYDAINTLISSAVVGGITCDRQGKIWAETDICVTTGTYNTGLAISNQDWMNEPAIEDRPMGEVSYLELGGIAYNGTTFEALMSAAPGVTPAYRGKIQRLQGLALTDQTQLNVLCGNLYAQLNARYPNVEIQLAGNYRNFDIAPQEIVPLTILPSDTIRGISFQSKSFFINNMRWDYNPRTEALLPVIAMEELASGYPGDSLDIPDVPPFEGDAGGFTIPPIVIPPIELPPWPTFPAAMVNFVPAISGFSPGLTAADFQVVGQIQPNYVIYFYAGSAGVAYGHTKAPSGLGGVASVYTVLEGFAAGTVSVEVQIFNITQNTSITSGVQAVVLIDGINFILPLSISYAPNDIILFVINYGAGSIVDAGIVGWSIS